MSTAIHLLYAGESGLRLRFVDSDLADADGSTFETVRLVCRREGLDDEEWNAAIVAQARAEVACETVTDGEQNDTTGIYVFTALYYRDDLLVFTGKPHTLRAKEQRAGTPEVPDGSRIAALEARVAELELLVADIP
jgi:hypothetical protein